MMGLGAEPEEPLVDTCMTTPTGRSRLKERETFVRHPIPFAPAPHPSSSGTQISVWANVFSTRSFRRPVRPTTVFQQE